MAKEKRRYYRLKPSEDGEPRASLELGGREIDLTVVNISPGGLLCYVASQEDTIAPVVFIPRITIQMPNKKPIVFTGRVVRTEEKPNSESKFCAIEFLSIQGKVLEKGSKQISQPTNSPDPDRYFLHRLESIKFIDGARSVKEENQIQQMLYDAFDEIARRLPLEERWFFYEILDAMKRQQPNYTEGLKLEFLRLCRGEDRSEFAPRNKDFFGWIKNFLKSD